MADPKQDSADRLSLERAVGEVIAYQNKLLTEQGKINADLKLGRIGDLRETSRLEAALRAVADSAQQATNTTNNLTTAQQSSTAASRDASSSYDRGGSSMSGLTTAAGKTIDKLVEMRNELRKISEDRYSFVTSLAEAVGGSSRLYAATARDVTSFQTEMDSYFDPSRIAFVKDYYEDLGMAGQKQIKGMKGVNDAQIEFIANIGAGGEAFKKAQYAGREFYGLASGFRRDENGQIVPDDFFRIQGIPIEDVFKSAEEAMMPLTQLLSDDTLSMSVAKKMRDEESADAMIRDTVRMSTAMKAFGMSISETTELVRLNYINTGEVGTDFFNSVTKAAMLGEKAFGYSSQQIIGDITKMAGNFETFGFRSADELAKVSAAARDAHLSISDLQGVMGKFNTFESAAGAVGQLNAALGTNFDALELMQLKFDDPAMFIQRLREGFLSAGKTFEEIPATYKMMITQTAGITMEGLRGILDGSVSSLDELTSQQESAEAAYNKAGTSEADRQKALDEAIKLRVKLTGDTIENAKSFTEQAERAANRFANTSNGYIERTAAISDNINTSATKFTQELIPKFNTLIETTANNLSGIIMGSLESAGKALISDFAAQVQTMLQTMGKAVQDFQKNYPGFYDPKKAAPPIFAPSAPPSPAGDIYVSPGGSTVVTANFGDMNQKSFKLDARDELVAKPPPPAEVRAPTPVARPELPAVSDAIRASLQGVGTSLRIELDVGQLTDLVLRDIMMNKPNVFGGVG